MGVQPGDITHLVRWCGVSATTALLSGISRPVPARPTTSFPMPGCVHGLPATVPHEQNTPLANRQCRSCMIAAWQSLFDAPQRPIPLFTPSRPHVWAWSFGGSSAPVALFSHVETCLKPQRWPSRPNPGDVNSYRCVCGERWRWNNAGSDNQRSKRRRLSTSLITWTTARYKPTNAALHHSRILFGSA